MLLTYSYIQKYEIPKTTTFNQPLSLPSCSFNHDKDQLIKKTMIIKEWVVNKMQHISERKLSLLLGWGLDLLLNGIFIFFREGVQRSLKTFGLILNIEGVSELLSDDQDGSWAVNFNEFLVLSHQFTVLWHLRRNNSQVQKVHVFKILGFVGS